jgi:hypothetical protein
MSGVLCAIVGMAGTPPLQVTASSVSGAAISPPSPETVFTLGSPNTTPTGGVPGYTYSWARVSGSTAININSPTLQNPTWDAFLTAPQLEVAVWRVTVTDSASNTATADITVTLELA